MRSIIVLCSLLIAAHSLIRTKAGKLYDNEGRQIVFHGPNVVVKIPPYHPKTDQFHPDSSFSEEDMKQLKQWGFNGIRLAVMWPGVEVRQSVYSQEYLNRMRDIVNLAGSYGIYSLIEFHQDIASQKFCGDGIPAWLIPDRLTKTFPMPIGTKHFKYNSSGLPEYGDCSKHQWGLYYFSFDVSYTFESLYTNRHGLLDKFEQYWIQVAKTFVGNEYVIAYELINEPFAGSPWKNPSVVIPSMAQRVHLQRFYDRLSTTIRKYDSEHPICFEPVTWDNGIPVGFSHPPGGSKYKDSSILCYHFYQPPSINLKSISKRVQDARRLGISSLLSEFWYKGSTGGQMIDEYNRYHQSWFFWGYKTFGKDWGTMYQDNEKDSFGIYYKNGTAMKKWVELLSQTYAQRLAGELISSHYDNKTRDYTLTYYPSNGTTIIYANRKDNYPNGIGISVVPPQALSVEEPEPNYFHVVSKIGSGQRAMISFVRL